MHYTSASVVVAATVVMKLFYTWCCIC